MQALHLLNISKLCVVLRYTCRPEIYYVMLNLYAYNFSENFSFEPGLDEARTLLFCLHAKNKVIAHF